MLDTSSTAAPDDELEGAGSSFSYTDVQTGELYFHLRVRDHAGRWSEVSTRRIQVAPGDGPSIAWTASSTHPDQAAWWPVADVSLSWASSSPATTDGYSWAFDESATTVPDTVVDITDTLLSVPGQADGQHYFHLRARGPGGVWGSTAHRMVRIDTTTPAVHDLTSSSHPDPDFWYDATSAVFAWEADGGPSGLGYSWSADQSASGEPDETVDGTTAGTSLALGGGEWYFHVKARSGSGLWSEVATRRVRIASQAPTISGLACSPQVSESTWYAADDAAFTWSVADGGSEATGYSWVLDQSAPTEPDTATIEGTSPSQVYADLADGVWYFHVRAVDAVGRWGGTAHRRIQIDSGAPAMTGLTSTSHPDETTWCRGSEVRLFWAGSDDRSGVAGYSWLLDHAAATMPDQTDDGPATGTTIAGVADGEWWAHVRCRDAAGNWSDARHRRLLVDGSGPVIAGTASSTHPDPSRWYRLRDAAFSWSASDTAGVAGYLCALDQSAATVPGGDIASEPALRAAGLADGVWYLHVRGRDVLGQEGGTIHRAVRIDTRGPSTFALANASVRKGGVARLRFKVTDPTPNGGSATVRIEIRSRRGQPRQSRDARGRQAAGHGAGLEGALPLGARPVYLQGPRLGRRRQPAGQVGVRSAHDQVGWAFAAARPFLHPAAECGHGWPDRSPHSRERGRAEDPARLRQESLHEGDRRGLQPPVIELEVESMSHSGVELEGPTPHDDRRWQPSWAGAAFPRVESEKSLG